MRTDKAAVDAAESQVRTLAATALQEWGPVIGNSVATGTALVDRLIEREEFLVQITLPPSAKIDPPPTVSVEVGGRRVDVRYISPATRTDPRIRPSLGLRAHRRQFLHPRSIQTDMPASEGGGFVVPVSVFGSSKPPEIVTQAAQLLLSEEFRAQIQVGGED